MVVVLLLAEQQGPLERLAVEPFPPASVVERCVALRLKLFRFSLAIHQGLELESAQRVFDPRSRPLALLSVRRMRPLAQVLRLLGRPVVR